MLISDTIKPDASDSVSYAVAGDAGVYRGSVCYNVDYNAVCVLTASREKYCRRLFGRRVGYRDIYIKASVQYGENLQALVVAMNTVGTVSINRTREILGSIFNIPLSAGTIHTMVEKCAEKNSDAVKPSESKLSAPVLDTLMRLGSELTVKQTGRMSRPVQR